MNAYLLYDKRSGRIVHRHRQDPDVRIEVTLERLRDLAGVATALEHLDIAEVDAAAMLPGENYRISQKTRALESASKRKTEKKSGAKSSTKRTSSAAKKRSTAKKATGKRTTARTGTTKSR
jgi:hypothetical protein